MSENILSCLEEFVDELVTEIRYPLYRRRKVHVKLRHDYRYGIVLRILLEVLAFIRVEVL